MSASGSSPTTRPIRTPCEGCGCGASGQVGWVGDAGIDLVAEDHDGRLWAIQAKAYPPENTITKADVDKFLAEFSRTVFSYRLLIATTDKRHHVARRTMDDQEKTVGFVGLSELLTSEVALRWGGRGSNPRPTDYESLIRVSATRRDGYLKRLKSPTPACFTRRRYARRPPPVRPRFAPGRRVHAATSWAQGC
jgi:Restriction endonuclease